MLYFQTSHWQVYHMNNFIGTLKCSGPCCTDKICCLFIINILWLIRNARETAQDGAMKFLETNLNPVKKNPNQMTPASQWWGIRGTVGTSFPTSWTILDLSCGLRSWKQPFHGHRESAVWNWDSWDCQNHWAHSKAAVGVRVPGGGISKSTVLLCGNHGDPGRAGFESETSSYVLLKFCFWKLENLEAN